MNQLLCINEMSDGSVELEYVNGSLFVTIFENEMVHISQIHGRNSVAIEPENIPAVYKSKIDKEKQEISAGNIRIKVWENQKLDIFYQGVLVLSDVERTGQETGILEEDTELAKLEGHAGGGDEAGYTSAIVKKLGKEDAVYGLGDKPGCLNRRGYVYVNWNTDNPAPHVDSFKSLYKSIPFFMVLGENYCYGIFADNTYKTTFDFGFESSEYYVVSHEKGFLDYYFFPGEKPSDVVKKYTGLTGTTPLFQRWIYGSHQSRWGYCSQDEILGIAEAFEKNEIPCDVIHMDIDYMDGYRVFTFDKERFPDTKALSETLADKGIKLISIIDPGVKKDEAYFMYREGMEMDAFAHDAQGAVYENAVWPGTSVFPDFSREDVRKWWGEKTKILLDHGIRGIWNDMNEPASFRGPLPDDVKFAAGAHDEIHNIYGHLMAKATYEGLLEHDNGRRPFVLTRAAYAGSQKYCGGWTGDNHSIWSHLTLSLEQICNLSLCGMAMCGSDIGGFGSDVTPELLVRFYQAAVFAPFFRNHSAVGTRRQEPWLFDEKTRDAVRKTVRLRYRFIPYIYDLARECERTGEPIVRPLVYEYPHDKMVRNICDEYLLGKFVLVAPVTVPGKFAREVYLPEGEWYDYETNEKYTGGKYILADAPLDKVPVFIRAGAILPVAEGNIQSTEDITSENTRILTYPGQGTFIHYEDDNETLAYREGSYNAMEYTLNGEKLEKKVIHKGYKI
ncbi:MAG: TIM-barrel domain-containing protein [Lachnospiraceae bacterium]